MHRFVLQFSAAGRVNNAEEETEILGLFQPLKDILGHREGEGIIQLAISDRDRTKFRIDAETFDQHVRGNMVERDATKIGRTGTPIVSD
jgi:hypothetical protein